MNRRALYFPYIRTPDDDWFTRVLLYWDTVGTIVPGGQENDPLFVTSRMRELCEAGMLELVRPALGEVPRFATGFLAYIDADAVTESRRGCLDECFLEKVHVWKLGQLADELVERGLARRARGPGWEVWLELEAHTADLFMAYLAVTLGAQSRTPTDPVTNHANAIEALVGRDSTRSPSWERAGPIRLSILEDLLPAPVGPLDVKQLAQFKADYRAELSAFRDGVEREILFAASLPDEDARAEGTSLALRALLRDRDDIVKKMQERRWPSIAFGRVAGVTAVGISLASFADGGRPLTAAAGAVPGIISAAYSALQGIRTRPDFDRRPMAYAALAGRHLT